MTDGIIPIHPEPEADRILVQLRLSPEFISLVERWQAAQGIQTRTKAVCELLALGLAGELLKVNTKAIKRRAEAMR